ncbi:LPS assembly lipoprotein LptE [Haloferula rosea]|uniref:Uncharacterized protein n=1 Tax=Haloferula rosea TaxID=490093 RepID=A0A934RCU6_9BACT|nr:LPS assembly lipoprotein LptE [Haloferula rosea]MBK1828353.1 hypothetical protein [Haloferula rosea]
MTRILTFLACVAICSCAGYQIDGAKPAVLKDVRTIAVPMFENHSLHPRAESIATSAATEAIVEDGTYRVGSVGDADAILEGTIHQIQYTQLRSARLDTLRPEELSNTVTLNWVLRDGADPSTILARGTSIGTSRFFVDSNLQTSRNNALPDALQRACDGMISRLANGY